MRRADRLFQIVQFLRSRRVTTARWLSDVLEVSERTIYRDIQDLVASAVPIEGEAGIGYVIRRGYDLPPLMFTRDEITALTLGTVDCRNKVALTYTRADGADSKRTIWPLGLFFWGTVWTLGAWCEMRQAFRNFRLDRIETLQVCGEQYPNEPGRTLEDMIVCEKKRMHDETL